MIFDPADLEAAEAETDSDDSSHRRSSSATDEDIPPFHLDLEESLFPAPTLPASSNGWQRRPKAPPGMSDAEVAEREKKAELKRIKSVARREQRRLDLLRGDGKSPTPLTTNEASSRVLVLPHQPARPSSLRLAAPDSPEAGFINNLLHLPLDSLSLSFAEVHTVTSEETPSLSTSADTVYAMPMTGEDMICVEALVVRKGGFGGEDEGWGFGGDEDGWGFGADELEEVGYGEEGRDGEVGLDWAEKRGIEENLKDISGAS